MAYPYADPNRARLLSDEGHLSRIDVDSIRRRGTPTKIESDSLSRTPTQVTIGLDLAWCTPKLYFCLFLCLSKKVTEYLLIRKNFYFYKRIPNKYFTNQFNTKTMLYELTALRVSRLDNLTFGELLKRTLEDVGKLPATTLTDATIKAYVAGLTSRSTTFNKAILKIMASEDTSKIAAADQARDLSLYSFRKMLNVFLTSDVAAEIDSAMALLAVLNKYNGLADFEYEKESNGIDKLVAELENATYSKHITKLVLARYLTRIKTANAAFRTLYAAHISTTVVKEVFDTKALRKEANEYYIAFCLYIQSMVNIPGAAKPSQFFTIFDLLNIERKIYADRLATHLSAVAKRKNKNEVAAASITQTE